MYKGDDIFKALLKYDFNLFRGVETVPDFLKNHLQQFVSDVGKANSGDNPYLGDVFISTLTEKLPLLQEFCDRVIEISNTYRDGRIKASYEKAYDVFEAMKPYYLARFSWAGSEGNFYRIRSGDFRVASGEDSKKKKAELFHIRDKQRNIIGAYRYSVSGFPCLYLAGGLELGWFESGMPRQFSYCKMFIDESGENALKLIDFSNRPIDLLSNIYIWLYNTKDSQEEQSKIYNYLLNYILTYPLAAACSIKVQDRNNKFVEEYVIPQMFMQWIRENTEYDGVRYKSSLNTTLVQGMGAVNIVLPVKQFRPDGLCQNLTSKIAVSDIGYFDVNEDFKRYQVHLRDIEDFKNELYSRMGQSETYTHYAIQLIQFCESIKIIYESLISGNYKNTELVFQNIDCLFDYKSTIFKYRESIISDAKASAEKEHASFNSEIALNDIERFHSLVSEVLHKYTVFHFKTEDVVNWEKI